jgi:hypothetical protein
MSVVMSNNIRRLPERATNSVSRNEVRYRTLKTGNSFAAMCRDVLGKNAGLQLSRITGYPESTCYRYSVGDTVPPVDFLARLFNSEVGEPYFEWLMADVNAEWWSRRNG